MILSYNIYYRCEYNERASYDSLYFIYLFNYLTYSKYIWRVATVISCSRYFTSSILNQSLHIGDPDVILRDFDYTDSERTNNMSNKKTVTTSQVVRAPPLMPQKIVLWFSLLERQLATPDITNDEEKATALLGCLESEYLERIEGITLHPIIVVYVEP